MCDAHVMHLHVSSGGGHHACVGQDLARAELKLILTRLMQRVTFHDTPENQVTEMQRLMCTPANVSVHITFD